MLLGDVWINILTYIRPIHCVGPVNTAHFYSPCSLLRTCSTWSRCV